MKNLYRKLKLIFRKPRVGEIWALPSKSNNFGTIKFHVKETYEAYGKLNIKLMTLDGRYSWEGLLSLAGPIYHVADRKTEAQTLEECVNVMELWPKRNP